MNSSRHENSVLDSDGKLPGKCLRFLRSGPGEKLPGTIRFWELYWPFRHGHGGNFQPLSASEMNSQFLSYNMGRKKRIMSDTEFTCSADLHERYHVVTLETYPSAYIGRYNSSSTSERERASFIVLISLDASHESFFFIVTLMYRRSLAWIKILWRTKIVATSLL